jgi:hypothetical protein
MFDSIDDEFAALVADLPELPPDLPEPDWTEPEWAEHPVYAELVPAAERLIQLLDLPPTARPTGEIALFDAQRLSPAARIDLLTLLEEQKHWLDSVQQQVLAEIDAADVSDLHLSQEAVSLALGVPTRVAQAKLKTASLLVRELPATLSMLRAGQISYRHTEVICEQAWSLSPNLVADFEGMALVRAADQTVGQLRHTVRRVVARIDPGGAERRHQHAVIERKVGFQPCEDGMVLLPVLLDAPQGQLIFTRLTAAATLLPSTDDRTMDQKRADLLVDAVLSGLPHDALPELQGRRPSIQIVVSADTLLGLDEEPADLAGYGPITAETARRYAADRSGTWRRLLTDPDTGALLDIGKDSYRPVQRLRDFVLARDSVCCFPTCGQPGYRCEFEHIVAFSQGGRTCRCGGALACKRHNLCKINTGWQYRRLPDGSYRWTDDTGHSYTGHPPQRWGYSAEKGSPPVAV